MAIALDRHRVDALVAPVRVETLSVNLADQTISAGAMVVRFDIDPDAKEMLLEGIDEIALTQRMRHQLTRLSNGIVRIGRGSTSMTNRLLQ